MLLTIFNYVWLIAMFCVVPAGVLWLCRKYPICDKIGPVMLLYAIGLVIANIPMPAEIKTLQGIIPTIMIPLAIPMMLFGCTFKTSELSLQVKLVTSGVISVCLAVVGGYLLFGYGIHQGAEIGGMLAGKCTGGTLNAAAIKEGLRISDSTYILLTTYDIVICFFYFVFLLAGGIRLFRWLYGEKTRLDISEEDAEVIKDEMKAVKANPYKGLWSKAGFKQIFKVLATTIVVVIVAAGMSYLIGWIFDADLANFMNEKKGGWFMAPFILMLTTIGIGLSFCKPIQKFDKSYDLGMYLIYILVGNCLDGRPLELADYGEFEYDCIPHIRNLRFVVHSRHHLPSLQGQCRLYGYLVGGIYQLATICADDCQRNEESCRPRYGYHSRTYGLCRR